MISFSSVIIGAPRSQTTLEVQRKINETGAIYKCNLDNNPNGQCIPFVFDPWGNVHENYDQYTYNNEKKDFQWLGAAMDGSANDNDKFVVSGLEFIIAHCANQFIIRQPAITTFFIDCFVFFVWFSFVYYVYMFIFVFIGVRTPPC